MPDFVDEQLIRDDGAGEADPEILEMLAAAAGGCETFGLNRLVGDSAQIRCSGLKGMLIASPRLKGSRKVEVPETMLKFGATDFSQECLSVLSFSRVRPTSLGLDVILRLEAAQCDMKALVQGHKRHLGLAEIQLSTYQAMSCEPGGSVFNRLFNIELKRYSKMMVHRCIFVYLCAVSSLRSILSPPEHVAQVFSTDGHMKKKPTGNHVFLIAGFPVHIPMNQPMGLQPGDSPTLSIRGTCGG